MDKKKLRQRIAAAAAIAVLLAVTVWANVAGARRDAERERLRGENASDWFAAPFSMDLINGGAFTRADLNRSRVTVINGWGLYCGPCVRELPELQALNEEYDPADLQIVTVIADYVACAYDEDELESARAVVKDGGITLPVMLADDSFTRQVWPMLHDSLPGTWIVDSRGNLIRFVANSRSGEEWKEIFDSCLEVS